MTKDVLCDHCDGRGYMSRHDWELEWRGITAAYQVDRRYWMMCGACQGDGLLHIEERRTIDQ